MDDNASRKRNKLLPLGTDSYVQRTQESSIGILMLFSFNAYFLGIALLY